MKGKGGAGAVAMGKALISNFTPGDHHNYGDDHENDDYSDDDKQGSHIELHPRTWQVLIYDDSDVGYDVRGMIGKGLISNFTPGESDLTTIVM